VYVTSTKGIRTSDTVEFYPHKVPLPNPSKIEIVAAAIDQLSESIQELKKNARIPQDQYTLLLKEITNRAQDLKEMGETFNGSPATTDDRVQRVVNPKSPSKQEINNEFQAGTNPIITDLGLHDRPNDGVQRVIGPPPGGKNDPKQEPTILRGRKQKKERTIVNSPGR
jgi:hypothetical protein